MTRDGCSPRNVIGNYFKGLAKVRFFPDVWNYRFQFFLVYTLFVLNLRRDSRDFPGETGPVLFQIYMPHCKLCLFERWLRKVFWLMKSQWKCSWTMPMLKSFNRLPLKFLHRNVQSYDSDSSGIWPQRRRKKSSARGATHKSSK